MWVQAVEWWIALPVMQQEHLDLTENSKMAAELEAELPLQVRVEVLVVKGQFWELIEQLQIVVRLGS